MNRQVWKWYYRQLRIARREAWKASLDCMIYGTGFVRVSEDGFINHIHPWSVQL